MLSHLRNSLAKSREKDSGFTLVELLVVVVILMVLAAIAVPIFLNQRTKAEEATTKTNVANAANLVASAKSTGSTIALSSGMLTSSDAGAGTQQVNLPTTGVTYAVRTGAAGTPGTAVTTAVAVGDYWCVSGQKGTGATFIATSVAPEPVSGSACPSS